jgi:hypothetical protein
MPPEEPGGEPEDPSWFDLTDQERTDALYELEQAVKTAEWLMERAPSCAKPRYQKKAAGLRAAVNLIRTTVPKSAVSHA